jgi:cell division protein FtsL
VAKSGKPGVSEQQRERRVPRELISANALVLALVLVSAFATIYSTHACRGLYTKLQVLESSQWYLQEDYGRLLLEESTQASHYRVEKVARSDLGMAAPNLAQFKVVPR